MWCLAVFRCFHWTDRLRPLSLHLPAQLVAWVLRIPHFFQLHELFLLLVEEVLEEEVG